MEGELRSLVNRFKSLIPQKAKKYNWPQFIWVTPSIHKNYTNNVYRRKFAGEMEQIIKGKQNAAVFTIKQVWQPNNDDLVYDHNSRLSPTGERRLWQAIDRTLWFADKILFKNITTLHRRPTSQSRHRLPAPTGNNTSCKFFK